MLDVEQAQSPAGEAALRIVVEEACRGAELLDACQKSTTCGRAIGSAADLGGKQSDEVVRAVAEQRDPSNRDFLASNSLRSPATPWSKLTAPSSGIAPYRIVRGRCRPCRAG
ncbi:MAG: hypothetical protein HS111_16050 [Kofleriaceae bacterium]|nr:hypothetical protein [Kofleriaceae bacterium]